MTDTQDQQGNGNQEEFGIGSETTSSGRVNFKGGFNKAYLVNVKSQEIGKNEKFFVLDFEFVNEAGPRYGSFTHREFIPKGKATTKENEKENYDSRRNRLNSRVKHIWETFAEFPKDGLGKGSKNWNEFFQKIAEQFNTGKEGKPIYEKVLVWTKNTYTDGGDIQFPLLPNFLERIGTNNAQSPKTLEINNKYDNTVQPTSARSPNTANTGVMGGGAGAPGSSDNFGFE